MITCTTVKQCGFTLLEVMVALGICAMAGIAVMQVNSEHINHLNRIESQTYASWVAENTLVEIRAQGDKWDAKNNKKGETELAGYTWYWLQTVTKTADDSFVKVDIEVFADSEQKDYLYTLSTYIDKKAKR